ncbi:glycerol-3-phosphate dehydrogenase, mitochondrial isoform X1 [Eurytemora carolleeae]|uniref:glycerol-3-phosphate dehydrogenase, mitochondrial isoform X1 n=1 Tax=Eurytemora carolleeae TaxID=1294199 RepID=UPI000C75E200|nr:glycerol-3-phosphate dehydrogenase, mitochondrial isoform X1 [Eurytemora carolleeae]|eukprot:XP_023349021.1 glycerol-3-phosphate dehydrogenase, mitochondrial-like isoform X1 [Eurytemora affinis]
MAGNARKIGKYGLGAVGVLGAGGILYSTLLKQKKLEVGAAELSRERPSGPLLSRAEQIQNLKTKEFDVLVIGGGATGSGCALDAVTRGLKTAMVELDDFSSGTSSRSTKLIHGGVRYLQKAIMKLDYEQYKMVKEALHERANLLEIAPHLSFPLPIMLPVYRWWQVPYFWAGIKAYDLVSGSECLKSSYFLNKERALELFPMLKKNELCGAIVYYDGCHNDARMNISIAITAARHGASIANHVKVVDLIKVDGKVQGAKCRNEINGEEFEIKAKCVINATGPFTDSIRKMDDGKAREIVCASAGVHIVLPDYYSPSNMGLLDPATSDGRVIFFLPWQNHTIAGTTDTPCKVTHSPGPSEADIQFILKEVKNYLTPDIDVRRGDVLSAWAGIRPLVKDPNAEDTQSLVRNHVVHVSESNMITIAGGKWTTYRAMASETVDEACKITGLDVGPSVTDGMLLEGAHNWTPTMFIRLVQDLGVDTQVAQHLAATYGDRAFSVGKMASLTGKRWPIVGKRIHMEFPYIDAEVRYAVKEYACTAIDILARRLRLSFLNVQAAEEALPHIVSIMAEELGWDDKEKVRQTEMAVNFLKTEMGKDLNKASRDEIPINLTKAEIAEYVKRFNALDEGKKGYVSINDIRRSFKNMMVEVSGQEIHELLNELDTNHNGQVEVEEYLQMMSAIKSGTISHSRFAKIAEGEYKYKNEKRKRTVYPEPGTYGEKMERSGGGV